MAGAKLCLHADMGSFVARENKITIKIILDRMAFSTNLSPSPTSALPYGVTSANAI